MATLSQKTDEIAALESLKKDLAKFEMKQAKATKADVKLKIAAKIKGLRAQIKAGKTKGKDVSAKQLANSLLRSRKKFLEMSKKDFNGVIRQLSKKPEYSFLKGMSRTEVINDINRKAKPVGWRFKGRENYKTPTKEQVRKGRANGTVYYENRPNRSDVSQARQLEKGGSTYAEGGSLKGHGLAIGDEIVNVYRDDIYVLNRGVVYMVDLSSGKRTMTKMSKDDAISTFKDGGEVKEDPQVIRYYFEDDGYEYEKGGSTHNDDPNDLYGAFEKGGEVDINDIEIPVHYTMFEEEMYEYGKGGIISVGDNVTVRSTGQTMEVSNISKNRSGQVEFTGSKGTFLIGGLKKN